MSRTAQVHGARVRSMQVGKPGTHDLVDHTLRHFLSPDEGWANLPPSGALDPAEARRSLGRGGASLQPPLASWSPPTLQRVVQAHDQGYWPRYHVLIQRAGPWARGGRWVELEARGGGRVRYQARVGTFEVFGDLSSASSGSTFEVRSAYDSNLVRSSESAAPLASRPFQEALSKCQALKPPALGDEGDELLMGRPQPSSRRAP